MKNLWFAALVLLGLPLLSQAAFPDVPSSHPHIEAINYVKSQGIVAGNPDGTFKPDQNISRAAFTKIVVETYFSAADIQACAAGSTSFSDVASNAWFAPYICVAAQKNLVAGYPDGTFRPGDNINVVEAAKIISAHRKGERSGSPWFKPYLDDLGEAGAIPTQVNAVDQKVTRGLMAEMIHRLDAQISTKSAKMFNGTSFVAKAGDVMVKKEAAVNEVFSTARYNALKASGDKFILNFSATWCPNCQRLKKTINDNLSDLPAGTVVLETDYDTYTDLKKEFGVTRQTTGVFFENGKAVETKSGLSFSDIESFFE